MTQTQHTPGPWRVGYSDGSGGIDDYNEYFVITSVANDEVVVSGGSGDTYEGPGWCYGIEDLDDARLIAAAPETAAERDRLKAVNAQLLEALEKIAKHVPGKVGHPSVEDCRFQMHEDATAAIKAATE